MVSYAQVDDRGVVVGVSELAEKVEHPHMIEIEEFDEGLLGQAYRGGRFVPAAYFAVLDAEDVVVEISSCLEEEAAGQAGIRIPREDYFGGIAHIGARWTDGKFVMPDEGKELKSKVDKLEEKLERALDMLKRLVIGA